MSGNGASSLAAVTSLRAQLWDAGYRPVPVFNHDAAVLSPGKQPLGKAWQVDARRDPPFCAASPAVPHALNTGVLADGLRPVDIDVDDPELAGLVRALAIEMLGDAPLRFRENSGRCLLLYRAAAGSPAKRALPGKLGKIEVLGHGQQFVAHGRHSTGVALCWHPDPPELVARASLPAVTDEQIAEFFRTAAPLIEADPPGDERKTKGEDHASADPQADSLRIAAALAAIPNTGPAEWEWWNKVGMAVWRATGGSSAGWEAWCAWSARNPAHDPAATLARWQHYSTSPPTSIGAGSIFHMAADADDGEPEEPDAPWQKYLQRDDHGQVIANLANAALALRQAPELVGLVAFDEMQCHTLVTRSLPAGRMAAVSSPRPLRDTDVAAIQEWLQRHKLRRLGREVIHQATDLVAREHAFHPVRDYLTGLTWDRTPRLDTWLSIYLGAEAAPYTAAIGRWFLIAMVARIMRPGCKCDYMLILEGDQGIKKSTACEILAGNWFSDALPELDRGDQVRISMHLRGKWLLEIPEMSAISKTEADALKAFLTQREERYTPKYGRNEVIEPRQCVFIGTTNKAVYLRDETGGRRSWPAKVGVISPIDTEALQAYRDQLFAEATNAFANGKAWWPDPAFEAEHIKPQQEQRFVVDAWESVISTWLETPVPDNTRPSGLAPRTSCTVAEVAGDALRLETARLGTADQRRITAALERLGWVRGKRTMHNRPWVRASDTASHDA